MEPYATYARYLAAATLALMATINIVGLRWGSLVQNVTTVAKYGGLLLIIILAFALGLPQDRRQLHARRAGRAASRSARSGWRSCRCSGRSTAGPTSPRWAARCKDPRRNLPRGIVLGTLAVIAIYLLANLAYLSVLAVEEIRTAKLVAADVAERLVGPVGVTIVSLTVLVSTFGSINGSMLTGPRIFFAMADDGLFFEPGGGGAPEVPDAVRGHPAGRGAGDRLRAAALLRAAGGHLRDRVARVLHPRRLGDLPAAPAGGLGPVGAGAALSRGARCSSSRRRCS